MSIARRTRRTGSNKAASTLDWPDISEKKDVLPSAERTTRTKSMRRRLDRLSKQHAIGSRMPEQSQCPEHRQEGDEHERVLSRRLPRFLPEKWRAFPPGHPDPSIPTPPSSGHERQSHRQPAGTRSRSRHPRDAVPCNSIPSRKDPGSPISQERNPGRPCNPQGRPSRRTQCPSRSHERSCGRAQPPSRQGDHAIHPRKSRRCQQQAPAHRPYHYLERQCQAPQSQGR